MSLPAYKIETYTGAVLDHTITTDAEVYTKSVATDAIGTFRFNVPTKKAGGYMYDDIAVHDKVKIYLGWDSVPANPTFTGYVTKIDGPLSTESGFIRVINGLDLGEVLLRRLKANKYWINTAVSGAGGRIIDEICTDLGLNTTDVDADANTLSYECRQKTYFDVLRDLADYWVNAGVQLKYDFWVDWNNDLNWRSRPLRTAGVESFAVGDNILSYRVTRNASQIKNDITVKGAAEKPLPSDHDGWTEGSSGDWTLNDGDSLADDAGAKQVGANSLRGYTGAAYDKIWFDRALTTFHVESINELTFYRAHTAQPFDAGPYIRLYAPDGANYFYYTWSTGAGDGGWRQINIDVGPANTYDATHNPNADWHEQGSPNWWALSGIDIYADFNAAGACYVWIDGLFFFPDRWSDTASDAASKASYGQRDLLIKDDELHSDSDCQQRSEALLFQRKDPQSQIELTTHGNTNVLLGDRIPMTIPAENISAANYDVFIVEHSLNNSGFITRATMSDCAEIRYATKDSPAFALGNIQRRLRQISQDLYRVVGQ